MHLASGFGGLLGDLLLAGIGGIDYSWVICCFLLVISRVPSLFVLLKVL